MKAGDWNEAISAYQNILDLDPDDTNRHRWAYVSNGAPAYYNLINAIHPNQNAFQARSCSMTPNARWPKPKHYPTRLEHSSKTIEQVRSLLQQYRDPVRVTLISDNAIEISLSNVGSLGPISERTLTLRPGKYTLRGSKDGCRDIYTEIVVLPDIAQRTI